MKNRTGIVLYWHGDIFLKPQFSKELHNASMIKENVIDDYMNLMHVGSENVLIFQIYFGFYHQ